MRTKRIPAFICALMMVVSLLAPAGAAESRSKVIDLGDGFYVVETITQYPLTRSGETARGSKTASLYQGSALVGTATLAASFDISGSAAKATTAGISGTGANGWTYARGTTRCSGNTAYGTAFFKSGSTEKPLSISLSCSPDGTVS